MRKTLFLLAVVALVFTSCKKGDDLKLDEQIIGKWITADLNGQSVPTNKKMVVDFVSTTKAYVSASRNSEPPAVPQWLVRKESNVVISGNKVTLTCNPDEHTTVVEEFDVTAITTVEFMANHKVTETNNGTVVLSREGTIRFTKVTDDYSQAILGMWNCKEITGGETNNDDNARLEFLADGTYKFYRKNEANVWSLVPRELNEYFVDGNFLATRWKTSDEKMNYECWTIDNISSDKMQWAALRQNTDGTIFQQNVVWQNVVPQTMLTGMDVTGMSLYGNVKYNYVYDADYRLVSIKAIQVDDNYVVHDLNLTYSDGHLSINGVSEGYSMSIECTLDNQGRITEMLRNSHSLTTDFTSSRTYTYTYYPDGHLQTETYIANDGPLTSTYVWENDELKSITNGDLTSAACLVTEFEPSDAPAQALFNWMGFTNDISELCAQGRFGKVSNHMASKRTLTVYTYGYLLHTTITEFNYTVENGRLSTIQEVDGGTYTLHWGER